MNRLSLFILIFTLSLGARLFFVTCSPREAPDSADYKAFAHHIMIKGSFHEEGSFLDIKRPPLYPIAMSFLYRIFGENDGSVRYAQAVLGSFIPILIFLIAEHLFAKRAISVLAAVLGVFHPELIVPCGYILTETLTTFLLTLTVFLILQGYKHGSSALWIAAGAMMGLTTLCRPVTLFFPVFLLFCLFFVKSLRPYWKSFLLFGAAAYLAICPWTIRNYIHYKKIIPISVGSGIALWTGSYIPWNGDYRYNDLSDLGALTAGKNALEADMLLQQEGLKNISQNPISYLKLCAKKVYRFWVWVPGNKRTLEHKTASKFILYAAHLPLLFLFLYGFTITFPWNHKTVIPVLIIAYFTLFHALLFAIPRYRIPVIPLLFAFCAAGALGLLSKIPFSRNQEG